MTWSAAVRSSGAAVLALLGAGAGGCGDAEGEPRDIPGLVRAVHAAPRPIDVGRAAGDVGEAARAARMPHAAIGEAIGPHRLAVESSLEVVQGDAVVERLKETATIALAAEGFHASLENSREYGRDVYFVGGKLYLRPRYGKFHRRPPVDDDEPGRVRGEIAGALGAYLELCAPGLVASDGGARDVGGRPARVVRLSAGQGPAAPAAAARPAERAWRADARIARASGELALDAASGAPLVGQLDCVAEFTRGGQRFTMTLAVTHAVSAIGQVAPIEPPAEDQIAAVADVPRELAEREALLEGIAPPAARARTPDNPTGASSATAPGAP